MKRAQSLISLAFGSSFRPWSLKGRALLWIKRFVRNSESGPATMTGKRPMACDSGFLSTKGKE